MNMLYVSLLNNPEQVPNRSHMYEVSNLGPQTIGGVEVRVAWPTADSEGKGIQMTAIILTLRTNLILKDKPYAGWLVWSRKRFC